MKTQGQFSFARHTPTKGDLEHESAQVSKYEIPVIDLFAGPGGLGEGFSTFDGPGYRPFRIGLSVEKDPHAHQTLRLRSFFRQFPKDAAPEVYYQALREEGGWLKLPAKLADLPKLLPAWERASDEAMCIELGPDSHETIGKRIERVLGPKRGPWVLIGGPPCQAYSLAGRVRNKGIADYTIEKDKRSKLYQEYLRIIADHRPTIFVMENVTGMLSATVEKKKVFETILSDLQRPDGGKSNLRYRVVPIVASEESRRYEEDDPRRFIVRCEEYGAPQQRHRVILIGLNADLNDVEVSPLVPSPWASVSSVIDSLPRLRSGISRSRNGNRYTKLKDDAESWLNSIHEQIGVNGYGPPPAWLSHVDEDVRRRLTSCAQKLTRPQKDRGGEFVPRTQTLTAAPALHSFLIDERLEGVCNHSTRAHLDTDLARYLFAAIFAKQHGWSPRLEDFPSALLPKHKNAKSGHFNDRFRVQLADAPATTITSHIAKDGHYFIHYDPTQCRSLTVREAA